MWKRAPRGIVNAAVLCFFALFALFKANPHRKTHGSPEALKLVTYEKDAAVIAICETWAGSYDNSEFLKMGFEIDDAATGFADAVQDFKEELAAEKK
jgi:hypothetical protein